LYVVSGNHGQNATFIRNWPETAAAAASGGSYAMVPYPSVHGSVPGSYPTSYYAFSTGGVRFYLLDASWDDSKTGTVTGSCGTPCAIYHADYNAHWAPASAQYAWLASDLAAHPGGIKLAFFHFPLHSDTAAQPADSYLDNTPGSVATLEQLLHDNGVQLVFNGHAHNYERFIATPGGVASYVTGGGGAQVYAEAACSATDAYAVGWNYSSGTGTACGAATRPATDSRVYEFLKVSVQGSTVTVTPTDSQGNTFDVHTYDFARDSTPPSAPARLTATQSAPAAAMLTWTAARDNIGVSAYDIYRDGTYLATVPATARSYPDRTASPGTAHTYQVAARDLAGNTARATVRTSS
jgi:hypothetical protein